MIYFAILSSQTGSLSERGEEYEKYFFIKLEWFGTKLEPWTLTRLHVALKIKDTSNVFPAISRHLRVSSSAEGPTISASTAAEPPK